MKNSTIIETKKKTATPTTAMIIYDDNVTMAIMPTAMTLITTTPSTFTATPTAVPSKLYNDYIDHSNDT